MLKKLLLVLFFFVPFILLTIYGFRFYSLQNQESIKPVTPDIITTVDTATKERTSIFIPYWDIPDSSINTKYDRLFYFGASANSKGIDTTEAGYKGIEDFMEIKPTNAYLTIRMLNTDENLKVLRNDDLQELVITQSIQAAKEYGFKGIVLDLELGVLPLNAVVENINEFNVKFYTAVKKENLVFMQTMYGDVFYRKRPFDVASIAKNSDEILIMAYDFHKVRDIPGPNFPLAGREKYGYDLKQMIEDYLKVVPKDKLTVIFGMYGYDWATDINKKPYGIAEALTLNEIVYEYIDKCDWQKCVQERNQDSGEMEINYVDSSSASYIIYHRVHYEDQESVNTKTKYLESLGIASIGFWAYGYF